MIEAPESATQLVAILRRPDFGGPLRYVSTEPASWKANLSMAPEQLDKTVERVAALALKLPRGALQGQKKAAHRKATYPEQGSVLRGLARAVRLCPEIGADPQALEALARKLARHANLRRKAGKATNSAIDLRLVLGALQWFMLRGVLEKVVQRLEAPDCTRAERELLEDKFSKLLLHKEELLAGAEASRLVGGELRKEVLAQAEEVERRTLVSDVKHAVRLGRPVDPQALETAARANRELKTKDPARRDGRKARR